MPTYREVPTESRSPKEELIVRLGQLGYSDDEIGQFTTAWDGNDETVAYTDDEKRALVGASDGTLLAELRAIRSEDDYHHTTPEEQAEREEQEAVAAAAHALVNEAREVVNAPVDDVLTWVDGDPGRALAAVVAEREMHDPERVTLTEPLERLVAAHA